MRILITAGNTQTPIDDVRVITNVFTGRTGSQIALTAHDRGHAVCLLTSHPELVSDRVASQAGTSAACEVHPYRTFDDLQSLMQRLVTGETFGAIIHCAAVSDYEIAGTYAPDRDTAFDADTGTWKTRSGTASQPSLTDVTAGKIKSHHPELWLRLVPTPKLIDSIRQPWGFSGVLVKFKLEVGPTDEELLRIAESSRTQSKADLMVANTRSGMQQWAFLGPVDGQYVRLTREELAPRLLDQVELLARTHPRPL